jgi:hypothetical protein
MTRFDRWAEEARQPVEYVATIELSSGVKIELTQDGIGSRITIDGEKIGPFLDVELFSRLHKRTRVHVVMRDFQVKAEHVDRLREAGVEVKIITWDDMDTGAPFPEDLAEQSKAIGSYRERMNGISVMDLESEAAPSGGVLHVRQGNLICADEVRITTRDLQFSPAPVFTDEEKLRIIEAIERQGAEALIPVAKAAQQFGEAIRQVGGTSLFRQECNVTSPPQTFAQRHGVEPHHIFVATGSYERARAFLKLNGMASGLRIPSMLLCSDDLERMRGIAKASALIVVVGHPDTIKDWGRELALEAVVHQARVMVDGELVEREAFLRMFPDPSAPLTSNFIK